MNVSPNDAEVSLAAIQNVAQRTRRSIAASGAHISLIATGTVWLIGFICTQFLSGDLLVYIWVGISVVGSAVAAFMGNRMGKRVRNPAAGATAKRIGIIWLLLAIYCCAAIAIAWPMDGKQLTTFIVLFVLIGWLAMGLLLSFFPVWPGLIVIALMLGGYFLFPALFYLWMGILVGGGMISLGVYIRTRW